MSEENKIDTQTETPVQQTAEESTTETAKETNLDDKPTAAAVTDSDTAAKKAQKNYPGGERFDPSQLPVSEDAAEIRKQVEFYFSDSNLSQDKFLFTMVSENDGWADLRSVANFKRMRRFQPFTAVVAALRESQILDVSENGEKIKRKEPLKPFAASNSPFLRSVYVSGFSEETKTMQIDLEKFFETFGSVKLVRLRRTDEGLFKGSVFVEFATTEEHKAFLDAAESEAGIKYEDTALKAMSKKAYVDMKEKEHGGFRNGTSTGKRQFNAFAASRNNNNNNTKDERGGGRSSGRGGASGGRGGRGGRGGGGRGRGRSDRDSRPQDRNQERRTTGTGATTEEGGSDKPASAPASGTPTGDQKSAGAVEQGEKRAAEATGDEPSKKAKTEQSAAAPTTTATNE